MIEVASLVGRLQIQLDGVRQAQQELVQIENQMRSLGNVSELELTKMANASDRATVATEKYAQAVGTAQAVQEEINSTFKDAADPLSELTRQYGVAQERIAAASTQVDLFTDSLGLSSEEVEKLNSLLEAGTGVSLISKSLDIDRDTVERIKEWYDIQQKGAQGLSPELQKVIELYEKWQSSTEDVLSSETSLISKREALQRIIDAAKKSMEEMNAEQEKSVDASKAAGGAAASLSDILQNRLQFSMSQIGQILRVIMSGRFSLSAFTALLGRAAIALAPLLAAVSPVIVAFGVFRSRIGQLGNQMDTTSPKINEMASNISALGQIDLSGLLTQLETASNRLSSFGVIDSDQAAEAIGQITQNIQALNATPGDANQVFAQVQQAVESANLSGLRDLDLGLGNTDELNRQLQEIRRESGLTAAQMETMGILAEAAMGNAVENGRRLTEELGTLQGLTAQMSGMWDDAVASNAEFGQTMNELGDTFSSLLSSAQPVVEWLVQQLNNIAQIADKTLEGMRYLWNSFLNWITDALGAVVEFIGWLNKIPFVEIDTSGMEKFVSNASQVTDGAARLSLVISELKDGMADGMEASDAFAASLGTVLDVGTIDVRGIERLQRTLDISNVEVRESIELFLRQAEAMNLTDRQVADLSLAYQTYSDRTADIATDNIRVQKTLEDFRREAQATASEIKGANGVIDALSGIGEAALALNQDASPANALQYMNAYLTGLEAMLDGGMEKIAMFREFVEVQLKPRLSTEAYESLISAVEATEAAAEQLAPDVDRFAGAAVTAADKADAAAGGIEGIGVQALNATSFVNGLSDAMVAIPNVERTITITTNEVLGSRVALGGGEGAAFSRPAPRRDTNAPVPAGLGLYPTAPTTATGGKSPLQLQAEAERAARSVNSPEALAAQAAARLTTANGGKSPEQLAAEAASQANESVRQVVGSVDRIQERLDASLDQTPDEFNDPFIGLANLLGRGGRGGGGGGGGDTGLDVEEIKRFLQEVNRAIAIASREGVRIGTAGNAIPFEEGSFLNAEGGGLSVDTILIRGVWDFADPAAKRQIINELQEALTALQAEV